MAYSAWQLPYEGTNIAVLADCHVRSDGLQFPPGLFPRLQGADLIVTLGGMGDRRGLDQLEEIAPVLGVRGSDDEWDLRAHRTTLVLGGEGYRLGCVHDAVAAGLAKSRHPFVPVEDIELACEHAFGGPVDVLLHAGTHRSEEGFNWRRGSALNPGSPTLPFYGARPTFIRLKVAATGVFGQIVWVA